MSTSSREVFRRLRPRAGWNKTKPSASSGARPRSTATICGPYSHRGLLLFPSLTPKRQRDAFLQATLSGTSRTGAPVSAASGRSFPPPQPQRWASGRRATGGVRDDSAACPPRGGFEKRQPDGDSRAAPAAAARRVLLRLGQRGDGAQFGNAWGRRSRGCCFVDGAALLLRRGDRRGQDCDAARIG